MDKKAIIATIILWVLIALFKCTQPNNNFTPNEGCEVLAHHGIMPEWVEGGKVAPYSKKTCWWGTASELKSLLLVASDKVVVMGHGSMTITGDSHIALEVTYSDLREWKREGQIVAAFSCRTGLFSPKVRKVSHKPFLEEGLLVWVKPGLTLVDNPRLAWGEAFGYAAEWGL